MCPFCNAGEMTRWTLNCHSSQSWYSLYIPPLLQWERSVSGVDSERWSQLAELLSCFASQILREKKKYIFLFCPSLHKPHLYYERGQNYDLSNTLMSGHCKSITKKPVYTGWNIKVYSIFIPYHYFPDVLLFCYRSTFVCEQGKQ